MKRAGAPALAVFLASVGGQAAPVGTSFSYQGRLSEGGGAVSGVYDFQFILYDADVGGAQVGPIVTRDEVTVAAGIFTVTLDFGAAFDGNARFLEVGVRPGASSGFYGILSPRQELTPAPHALFSATTGDPSLQRRTVAPTCATGRYVRSIAATGMPTCPLDTDTNSGGTVTSLTAGTGLTGGTVTLSGTVAVAFGGTGAASTAVRSDHDHGATYQAKITGGCLPGFSVRQVNADGSVVCEESGVLPGAAITTLDAPGDVGSYTSVTIGADGLGLISYLAGAPFLDLKVAHCNDVNCTSATLTTLDSVGTVGGHTSVTIGADGLGLISYRDFTNADLKVAHCNDVACTTATLTTLDSAGDVGSATSVTIGADGLGLISYYDSTNGDLKVAHCNNAACTGATLTTLDGAGNVGLLTAVTIGADGLGLIAYYDGSNGDLKVAHCDNTACTAATLTPLDSAGTVGSATSVTIGADGLGLISYYGTGPGTFILKVAHCSNVACTTATLSPLENTGGSGSSTSLAIGADGLGLVAYLDGNTRDLRVAHCANPACTIATFSAVDSAGDVGGSASLTIGADGLALISYWDTSNGNLKVAHCGNVLCSPFVARRP
jgi:hypothetical protein